MLLLIYFRQQTLRLNTLHDKYERRRPRPSGFTRRKRSTAVCEYGFNSLLEERSNDAITSFRHSWRISRMVRRPFLCPFHYHLKMQMRPRPFLCHYQLKRQRMPPPCLFLFHNCLHLTRRSYSPCSPYLLRFQQTWPTCCSSCCY